MQTMARLILRFVGVDPNTDLAMFAPVDGEIPILRLKIGPEKGGKPVAFGTLVDVTFVRSSNRVVRYSWLTNCPGGVKVVVGEVRSIRVGGSGVTLELHDGNTFHSFQSVALSFRFVPVSVNDCVRFRTQDSTRSSQFYDLEILDEEGDPKEEPAPVPQTQAEPRPRGTLFDSMAAMSGPAEDHGDRLTILPKTEPEFVDPQAGDFDHLLGEPQSRQEAPLAPTDAIRSPEHYGAGGVYEARKVIAAWGLGFNLGNVLKYIRRHGKKPGAAAKDDLKKCIEYIKFELEELEAIEESSR